MAKFIWLKIAVEKIAADVSHQTLKYKKALQFILLYLELACEILPFG